MTRTPTNETPFSPEGAPSSPNWFFRIRVTFLLLVLGGVLTYAYVDRAQRQQRRDWSRTLMVGIIVVEQAPLAEGTFAAIASRKSALEEQLDAQMRRHSPGGPKPFSVGVLGPVAEAQPPPPLPTTDSLVDLARYQWQMRRWVSAVDDRGKLNTRGYDSRIYLVARPPVDARRKLIEGASEDQGRVGVVSVELDASMVDLALFVATHELFHTLGATDLYLPGTDSLPEQALAEPDLVPLYPQRMAEVMARHRAVSFTESRPPTKLSELAVGPTTAREIGWLR